MKRLFLYVALIPFAGTAGLNSSHFSSTNLIEVRGGQWPINLERDVAVRDTSYALLFRDQQVMNGIVMDTLPFPNLQQLKYFGKALSALKAGTNGDIAKFKQYSIKRADKKYEGTWYILRVEFDQFGLTDFQQPEADIMSSTIRAL